MQYPYLFWLIIFDFIPTILIWCFFWRYLKRFKKMFIVITIAAFIWGLAFDLVGSPLWCIWHYSNTLGIWALGLPIEEYIILLTLPQLLTSLLLVIRNKVYE